MVDLKCSKCGSKNIYTTSKNRVCRKCGFKEEIKFVEEEKQ